MSIIQKLWWFFKLEKRRYLVGIVALVLVSVLNLIPPMVMGQVIDAITSGQLTQHDLLLDLFAEQDKTPAVDSPLAAIRPQEMLFFTEQLNYLRELTENIEKMIGQLGIRR